MHLLLYKHECPVIGAGQEMGIAGCLCKTLALDRIQRLPSTGSCVFIFPGGYTLWATFIDTQQVYGKHL